MNDSEPLHILQIDDEIECPEFSAVGRDSRRTSAVVCRIWLAALLMPVRRRPKPGNIPEHQPRHRDLGHLERNVAAVADDLGTDFDQLLAQGS
jgi:hypothetical protein